MPDKPQDQKPGFGSIILSTLSAFIGIQSSKNRERDFAKGNFKAYVISGLIFTVAFITSIVMLVRTIIHNAGM